VKVPVPGFRRVAVAVALAALGLGQLEATPARRPLRVDDLYQLAELAEPALSPDGAWVAYSVTTPEREADESRSDVWLVPSAGGAALQVTNDPKSSDWLPRFSPDGRWLAFLSDRGGDETQVWRLDRRGGEPTRLTGLPGGVSDFAWAPDSSRLVLVGRDPRPDGGGSKDDEKRERPKPIVVDRLQFKVDGRGFLDQRRTHLYLFDLRSKSSVQLTGGRYDDSEPAFSPDGRSIAFTSNRTEEPDSNDDSDIFVADAIPGSAPRRLSSAGTADGSPAWSPDGRWLAWVERGELEKIYYATSHVAVAPAAGGEPRALTRELDRNVYSPRFAADGGSVLFYYEDHGNQPLGAVSLAGGVVEEVVGGERHVSAFDVGARGEVVVLESSVHQPAEISLARDGELTRLTHANDEFLEGIRLAPVERFTTTNAEGVAIEGFLFRPPVAEAGRPLPAVLRIHGGPVDQFSTEWSFERQILAAHGYAVIAANPRGSSGRGQEFAHAIWADWGNKDYDDVMAAVDHAVVAGVADPERLGVYGWSYGGILTNYVITKTTRFKAAISGASEVNYLANYGHDHYQKEWEAELGLPWQASAKWVELSPFFRIEKVTTPTLVVCGQDDWNVPLINSEQLYQALRRLGKTTELVIYPGQGHAILRPSFQKDRLERYLAWFDRHLLGKPAPAAPTPRAEAKSLLGGPLPPPTISAAAKSELEKSLETAYAELAKSPRSVDAAIWVARRLGYLGRYREAIDQLTRALAEPNLDPKEEVRLLRHRGHRYVTVRELDPAIADLSRAGRLIRERGLADEVEPDGAPNDLGIPTSTTQFNVWYHLGLAHYLKGDFESALVAYRACLETAKGSNDRLVATTDWLWLTLMRLERRDEAATALAAVAGDLEVIEDQVYLDRIRLYKGEIKPDELLAREGGAVDVATRSYGVGAWYLVNGDAERARQIFERTLTNAQWGAFAVIAAEAELARMRAAAQ
jgi:dipeptidyl aminopeptidase/acylaminoacyl peptidase